MRKQPDYRRLRNFSDRVFGRALFLPVACWILENRRRKIYPTELTQILRVGRIEATDSQVSGELRELQDLEMIRREPKEWRRWPYRFAPSNAWDLIKAARDVAPGWRGGRGRRPTRGS